VIRERERKREVTVNALVLSGAAYRIVIIAPLRNANSEEYREFSMSRIF
jgi:hypothetical protein